MSELTDRGMAIYSTIQRTCEQLMRDAMSDWQPGHKDILLQQLTRLLDSMRKFD